MNHEEYRELILEGLVRHGIDRGEAEFFIKDHGVQRAYVWLRTCKQCNGYRPLSCGGAPSERNPA